VISGLISVWRAHHMGVTDGRKTPRPYATLIDDAHKRMKSTERLRRSCPLSAPSDTSRPVVVSPLKRPHDGQQRVSFVLAVRPDSRKHGGNVFAERCVKSPKVKGGTPSHATRDHPL